jgi:hypothetical protein
MIIDANDDLLISMNTHIIDKRTGDDLTKKHPFSRWDTIKKKGQYIIQDMDGKPVWYPNPKSPDGGEFEVVKAKFPHAKTQITYKSADSKALLEFHYPDIHTDKDVELVPE